MKLTKGRTKKEEKDFPKILENSLAITKNIFRNANGVLFVYDVTVKKSFESIREWIKDTQKIDKENANTEYKLNQWVEKQIGVFQE